MSVPRLAAWSSTVVVALAVIAGLMISGSPLEQRLERLDERRVADLQQLALGVDGYHETHGTLPVALVDIVDGRRLSRLPEDPAAATAYRYEVISDDRYRLCASFDLASAPEDAAGFWRHPAGAHCFDLEVAAAARPR